MAASFLQIKNQQDFCKQNNLYFFIISMKAKADQLTPPFNRPEIQIITDSSAITVSALLNHSQNDGKQFQKDYVRQDLFIKNDKKLKYKKVSIISAIKDYSDRQISSKQQKQTFHGQRSNQYLKKTGKKPNTVLKQTCRKTQYDFKAKIQNFRIHNLVLHYIQKLKRNLASRNPVIFQPFESPSPMSHKVQGIELSKKTQSICFIISSFFTLLACLLSTFLIIFQKQIRSETLSVFIIMTLLWFLIQILLGFIIVKQKGTHKLKYLKDISLSYIKSQFIINFIAFVSVCFYFVQNFNGHQFFHLLVFLKLPNALAKYKFIQNKIVQIFNIEQYWGIIKMFVNNFFMIHMIAIALLLMSFIDSQNNWIIKKQISDSQWFQKYSWAFYWSATTMLTVGFGDISAANYKQALTLVVIQTISCMTLAYNINLMGKLLGELRRKQIQKQKGLKILKQLCDRSEIQPDLQFKLTNHIKQTYKLETKSNFDEQQNLLARLPENLKGDFLRESNVKIVQKLHFIKNMTNRTIIAIAQKLEEKMTHPWQIAYQPQFKEITILKQGTIGICPNFKNLKYGNIAINKFQSNQKQYSQIVSMDFARVSKKTRNYDLKSIGYSIINWLGYNQFLQIIKKKPVDFQYFYAFQHRQLKNQEQTIELLNCEQCKAKHSKFDCPKLHYCPIYQKVIFKYLASLKMSKNLRQNFQRKKRKVQILRQFRLTNRNVSGTMNSETFLFSSSSGLINDIFIKCLPIKQFQELQKSKSSLKQSNNSKRINFQQKIELRQLAEDVKAEVFGLLSSKNNIQVDFWTIQLDEAYDFVYYFAENNPKKVQNIDMKKYNQLKKTNNNFVNKRKQIAKKLTS